MTFTGLLGTDYSRLGWIVLGRYGEIETEVYGALDECATHRGALSEQRQTAGVLSEVD